ncbi:MAG TPA: hypothetical protein VGD87_00085, partial [Archangium sp.]
IPSQTIILPAGLAFYAQTIEPENKFDPASKNWSIKVEWEGAAREAVEKMLGHLPLEALETKKAEMIEEARAKRNKVDELKYEQMTYELPWRAVMNKETAEPTGAIEMVFKRPELKMDRFTKTKVPNSPPYVCDKALAPFLRPIPNRSLVIVKFATWPVYFPADNKAGIKRLLESIQVVSLPTARRPDASGFEAMEPDHDDETDHAPSAREGAAQAAAPGADY